MRRFAAIDACFGSDSVAELPKCRAANFPQIDSVTAS